MKRTYSTPFVGKGESHPAPRALEQNLPEDARQDKTGPVFATIIASTHPCFAPGIVRRKAAKVLPLSRVWPSTNQEGHVLTVHTTLNTGPMVQTIPLFIFLPPAYTFLIARNRRRPGGAGLALLPDKDEAPWPCPASGTGQVSDLNWEEQILLDKCCCAAAVILRNVISDCDNPRTACARGRRVPWKPKSGPFPKFAPCLPFFSFNSSLPCFELSLQGKSPGRVRRSSQP